MTRIVTQNIDFTLSYKAWGYIVRNLKNKADIICFQEAKNVNLHTYANKEWGVIQTITKNPGTAGTAIMYRRSHVRLKRTGMDRFVPSRRGVKMEDRFLLWGDFQIIHTGRVIRVGSAHYPPRRFDFLWGEANNRTSEWVSRARRAGKEFVLCADYNAEIGKGEHGFGPRLNVRLRSQRIDGFLVSRKLSASKVRNLGNNASDHDPLQIRVKYKNKRRFKRPKKR